MLRQEELWYGNLFAFHGACIAGFSVAHFHLTAMSTSTLSMPFWKAPTMAHNQLQDRYQDLKTQYEEHRDLVSILRRCLNELEGNQEMLSGQFQGLHYGVVML